MKVYAHRGDSGRYPENTMLAFREAAKTGCDGIELDVQLTKDGTVVIIHDETIDRTTDGSGYVKNITYQEIRKFHASKICGGKYGFEPIPCFEEYCDWVKDQNLITNIELKTNLYYYEELEEKTLQIIRKYGLERQVMFSSFNHVSLLHLKKLAPEIPCCALVEHKGIGNAGYYCSKYQFEYYHPDFKGVTEEVVHNCKAYGIHMNVWTVNDMEPLGTLYEWGCDGVISNFPGACKAWLESIRH